MTPEETPTAEYVPLGEPAATPFTDAMTVAEALADPAAFVAGATETQAWCVRVKFRPATLTFMLTPSEWRRIRITADEDREYSLVTTTDEATFARLKARFERVEEVE